MLSSMLPRLHASGFQVIRPTCVRQGVPSLRPAFSYSLFSTKNGPEDKKEGDKPSAKRVGLKLTSTHKIAPSAMANGKPGLRTNLSSASRKEPGHTIGSFLSHNKLNAASDDPFDDDPHVYMAPLACVHKESNFRKKKVKKAPLALDYSTVDMEKICSLDQFEVEADTPEERLVAKMDELKLPDGTKPVAWQESLEAIEDLERAAIEAEKRDNSVPPIERFVTIDAQGRAYGTGRRKCSVARVWISPSTTQTTIRINAFKDLASYFHRDSHRLDILSPFLITQTLGQFDVTCTVTGGGKSGQAGAIRHGIARALQAYDPLHRKLLKPAGLMTRDPRMVERKKAGQPKARKKFQWVRR